MNSLSPKIDCSICFEECVGQPVRQETLDLCSAAEISDQIVITTKCNHIFHQKCLGNWLRQPGRESCPICRTVLVENGRDSKASQVMANRVTFQAVHSSPMPVLFGASGHYNSPRRLFAVSDLLSGFGLANNGSINEEGLPENEGWRFDSFVSLLPRTVPATVEGMEEDVGIQRAQHMEREEK